MADRILRDELWQSDRFLDLPTDAARLAFMRFVSLADDFGNFEGGSRRLYRILNTCTQVKSEQATIDIIAALIESDLLRRYEIEGRELFHIPRFRSHRQYLSRAVPASPWCDASVELGKTKRVINKGLAKNVATTSLLRSNDVAEGVGVGVKELQLHPSPDGFREFWETYPRKIAKQDALKAWKKLNPTPELQQRILSAVAIAVKSEQWRRDGGKFIPHASTWLNGRRFEDEGLTLNQVEKRLVV